MRPRRPFADSGIEHQASACQRSEWQSGAWALQAMSPRLDQNRVALDIESVPVPLIFITASGRTGQSDMLRQLRLRLLTRRRQGDVGAIEGLAEKGFTHKLLEQHLARAGIHLPQATRLSKRQAQARHFVVFPANASDQ